MSRRTTSITCSSSTAAGAGSSTVMVPRLRHPSRNYVMVSYRNVMSNPAKPPAGRRHRDHPMPAAQPKTAGRPRNRDLDTAILAAAGRRLGELGYARMSLESVAAAAGTTVPSLRRRYRDKAELVAAVI